MYLTMTGKELIEEYKKPEMIWNSGNKAPRNSIWCSEYCYYDTYSVYNSFTEEELLEMSEKEIDHLLKLAETIGEALY